MKATRRADEAIAEMQMTLTTIHRGLKARDEKIATGLRKYIAQGTNR